MGHNSNTHKTVWIKYFLLNRNPLGYSTSQVQIKDECQAHTNIVEVVPLNAKLRQFLLITSRFMQYKHQIHTAHTHNYYIKEKTSLANY